MPFALPPDDLPRLIATERAFSARCGQVGLRRSFMEYFAPNGLLFAPEATNARAYLRRLPEARAETLLQWEPIRAELSSAGDLGFSTGPIYVTHLKTKRRSLTGTFFSVWQRQKDGRYQVLLDLGTPIRPAPARRLPFYRAPVPSRAAAPEGGFPPEADFQVQVDRQGYTSALRRTLSPDAWLYRAGSLPLSVPAARSYLDRNALAKQWKIDATYLAQSRDLLITRGHYELVSEKGPERGHFIRVWRHQPEGWRLVIDLLAPLPA